MPALQKWHLDASRLVDSTTRSLESPGRCIDLNGRTYRPQEPALNTRPTH